MNELAIQELSNSDLIRSRIFTIRGVQVMLDRDLAELCGVEVSQLNRQVKRNIERFPDDFMFQLTREECSRCQIGILNGSRGSNIHGEEGVDNYRPVFCRFCFAAHRTEEKDVEVLDVKNSRSKLLHDVDVAQFNAQYANSPAA